MFNVYTGGDKLKSIHWHYPA